MNSMTGKGGSSYDTKKKVELDLSTSEELEKLAKEITSQSRVIVAKMKLCWRSDLICIRRPRGSGTPRGIRSFIAHSLKMPRTVERLRIYACSGKPGTGLPG